MTPRQLRATALACGLAAGLLGAVPAALTAEPAPEARPASVAAAGVVLPAPRPDGLSGLSPSDAAWRTALAFAGDGEWERALRVRGREADPLLTAILDWRRLRDSRQATSFAEIERFVQDHPGWPFEGTLTARAEAEMTDDISLFRKLTWFAAHPPQTTDGRLAYLAALAKAGDETALAAAVRDAWARIEFGKHQETAFIAHYGALLRPSDHIERLDGMLWRGKAGAARQTLKYVPEGWRKLADARLRLRFRQAGVDAAVERVPADLRDHPGLLYERLRWRRKAGMHTAARELMFEAPPSDEFVGLWWQERSWHIREALDEGEFKDAYLLAASHNQTSGGPFADAEWLAGWIALRFLDEPEDALRHFEQLSANVSTPISSGRAAYWAGRAAEAAGREQKAKDWYAQGALFQTTFYGQLAAARLGVPAIHLPDPVAPGEPARTAFEAEQLVAVTRSLVRLRLDDLSCLFLRHLAIGSEDVERSALIAQLAADAGQPGTAVFTARRAAVGRMILPALGYPLLAETPPDGPEPALVHAIIRQESSFEPTAVSRVGARGLMQLMPATAKATARSIGLEYDLGGLIADPPYNVRLGSAYLKQMVDRFNGHYIMAIASYNAGPGRIDRWIKAHGDPNDPSVDVIDWIERIPFSETRNYVQRVLEALHVYRDRLAHQPDHDRAIAAAGMGGGAQKVWCVYACGVLLDTQQAALRAN